MRENVIEGAARSLCALTLYITSWTAELSPAECTAEITSTSLSTLHSRHLFLPSSSHAGISSIEVPAGKLPSSVWCWATCNDSFVHCAFPDTSTVTLSVSLKPCCPLLFTLDSNDLLPGKGCRCDHFELKHSRGKRFNGTFISLLRSAWIAHHWNVLGNYIPWKFYSLKIFPS